LAATERFLGLGEMTVAISEDEVVPVGDVFTVFCDVGGGQGLDRVECLDQSRAQVGGHHSLEGSVVVGGG
jgi:hypothetical protein